MVYLLALIFGEEQNFVCPFYEFLALRPDFRDSFNLLKDLLVFESQYYYFVLQNCELQDSVKPRAE